MAGVVLIVNPYSSKVSRPLVAEVTERLRQRAEVTVLHTEGRGHARELAAQAAGDADALVVFSGDGTYNEAINGAAGRVPFGFVPGGGASVFPRALGLPRDPVAAADHLSAAIAAGRMETISLGRVNGRLFCFAAGIGFDAEAVRRIEARGRDRNGKRAGNLRFIATVASVVAEDRFRMRPRLTLDGYGRAAFALVANGRPYTYAGPVPVVIAGGAKFGDGLDFVAPPSVGPLSVLPVAWRLVTGRVPGDGSVLTGHDVDVLRVACDVPMPLQADGEDLGDVTEATFEAVRGGLTVFR